MCTVVDSNKLLLLLLLVWVVWVGGGGGKGVGVWGGGVGGVGGGVGVPACLQNNTAERYPQLPTANYTPTPTALSKGKSLP